MNKCLISILLMTALGFGTLGAVTGLYSLSFGDSREAAVGKLESQGFQLAAENGPQILLEPKDDDLISGVELRFAAQADSLAGWSIAYKYFEEEDMGELVIGALISRHGPSFGKSSAGVYLWDLGDGMLVSAGWDYFRRNYVVDYRRAIDAESPAAEAFSPR